MTEEKNEFENLDVEDEMPEQEFASDPNNDEDLISRGDQGVVYDYTKAPDRARAPPRINLDGKETTIEKAEIVLPGTSVQWTTSRNGNVQYKGCVFRLYYDVEGQQEQYSGVRVFKRDVKINGQDVEKYSDPTIMPNGENQASKLKQTYAKFKGKTSEEVSLKEFMSFLNSKPKAKIKAEEVKNPVTGEVIVKNFVSEFLKE